MHSSNSELCRLRSKSCYSSHSSHHPHSHHSSSGTYVCRSDPRNCDSCTRLGSLGTQTVEIHEENVTNIDLPPLMWFGYNKVPKILSATNTGRTILLNGQWACGRPYITGGPLNGSYIFSQIHFHSPSEHEIDGRRYPLEMHMVLYKNSYLTQERAMKEKDGTVVLVYLFQLTECGTTIISQISKLASSLERKNTRQELPKFPLDHFAKPFNSNYYTYRSLVPTDRSCYSLQWIISCNNLMVTRHEVEELLFVMSSSDSIGPKTAVQPENDVVFRVGEEDYCDWLSSPTTENPCCHPKKAKSKTCDCKKSSTASVCEKPSKKSSKKCLREKPSKKCLREKPSKKCVCEKPSKKCVCEKPSKKCVCEKPSKKSVHEKCSKTSVNKKDSKTSASKKDSKTSVSKKSVSKKSSKTSANKKASKSSVNKISSESSVIKTNSKGCVSKKSSKVTINEKISKASAGEEPVCEDSCNIPVCEKPSDASACGKSSKISVCGASSGTSCTSVKGKKGKKRSKSKGAKVDNCTNTTPSCSTSDVKGKKKKEKKPKESCASKKQSKSSIDEKCSSKDGKSQTNVKIATSSNSKENAAGKKASKKSGETKSCKMKGKKTGDVNEKSAETHVSKTAEKMNCSDAGVKEGGKSSETIKTIYEKKGKCEDDLQPLEGKAENCELPCVAKCSDTTENVQCARIGDNIGNNEDSYCDDVQINYLFVPNTSSSVHSNVGNARSDIINLQTNGSLTEKGNTMGLKDFVKLPSNPVLNKALVKSPKLPTGMSGQSKQFYLHTKHIFRKEGNSKGFTPRNFQECLLLIERDHNVLQEYNCKLDTNQLSPGNYEQLDLLPRYPDSEDLKIHATECLAKLESQHELSIRAKFLISDTNLSAPKSGKLPIGKKSKSSRKAFVSFFDAECQCGSPSTTNVAIDTKSLEEELNPCKSLVKWDIRNAAVENSDFKNTEIVNMDNVNLLVDDELDSIMRNEEEKLKKALAEQNGAIKLLKNPNPSGPEPEIIPKDSLEQRHEQESEKAVDGKSSMKNLQHLLGKPKKTTFFVYDRIEKDENSGKKIFVGSFRTKDEIEVLYKHRNIFQSDRIDSDLLNVQSTSDQALTYGNEIQKDISEKLIKAEDSQAVNIQGTSKDENPDQKSDSKQLITLHKFEPKHCRFKTVKEKPKNFIIGRISSKVDTESEKYSQLASMLGLDQAKDPKISFYEFEQSDTPNAITMAVVENSRKETSEEIDKNKVFPSVSDRSDSFEGDLSEDLEGTSSSREKTSKSSDKKESQTAVVVIPIEVESLSRVEIVFIQHSDDVKKAKAENKYTSYLKHYKGLILKLNSSLL